MQDPKREVRHYTDEVKKAKQDIEAVKARLAQAEREVVHWTEESRRADDKERNELADEKRREENKKRQEAEERNRRAA